MNAPDKVSVHAHCMEVVQVRIRELEAQIAELAESVANETKSTAGDKYETARAMLHIEQDQIRRQVAESRAQLAVLNAIDPKKISLSAGPGSLIQAGHVWYFLATSLGKVPWAGVLIFAISMQSPVAQQLRGLGIGDEIQVNNKKIRITSLL